MADRPTFQIFRAASAPTLEQTDVPRYEGLSTDVREGLASTSPKGVEFVEFRHANSWNIVCKYRNPGSWEKAASTARGRSGSWPTEPQPFGLVEPVG